MLSRTDDTLHTRAPPPPPAVIPMEITTLTWRDRMGKFHRKWPRMPAATARRNPQTHTRNPQPTHIQPASNPQTYVEREPSPHPPHDALGPTCTHRRRSCRETVHSQPPRCTGLVPAHFTQLLVSSSPMFAPDNVIYGIPVRSQSHKSSHLRLHMPYDQCPSLTPPEHYLSIST